MRTQTSIVPLLTLFADNNNGGRRLDTSDNQRGTSSPMPSTTRAHTCISVYASHITPTVTLNANPNANAHMRSVQRRAILLGGQIRDKLRHARAIPQLQGWGAGQRAKQTAA